MSDHEPHKARSLKELWRASNALSSLYEAIHHLEAMLKLDRVNDGLAWQAHWIAFVVSYSRPFTKNHGLGKEQLKLSSDLRDLHREICERHRNKCIAHTDPSEEELNELVFTLGNGTLRVDPVRSHPTQEFASRCHGLAIAASDALADRVRECLNRFPDLSGFLPGNYRARLGCSPGEEWELLP